MNIAEESINKWKSWRQKSTSPFPGTEEILRLAKGKLEVTSDKQTDKIGKGDSIYYRADLPHCLRNIGKSKTEAYMIVRYIEQ